MQLANQLTDSQPVTSCSAQKSPCASQSMIPTNAPPCPCFGRGARDLDSPRTVFLSIVHGPHLNRTARQNSCHNANSKIQMIRAGSVVSVPRTGTEVDEPRVRRSEHCTSNVLRLRSESVHVSESDLCVSHDKDCSFDPSDYCNKCRAVIHHCESSKIQTSS